MLEHLYGRIKEKAENNGSAPVRIIPFGDSVTQGCMAAGIIDHTGVYHNIFKQKLKEAYPQCTFSVYNADISGASAGASFPRLDRDVIQHRPDLVILGFCLNDATGGWEQLESFKQNIRFIVERIKTTIQADIIILTPNFMASYETSRIVEVHRKYIGVILKTPKDGILKECCATLNRIAGEFNIPVADIYAEWEAMAAAGIGTTSFLINGLNHPDAERQKLIAEKVFSLIRKISIAVPSTDSSAPFETPLVCNNDGGHKK